MIVAFLDFLLPFFSFTLAYSRISHEYLSLFIFVINLIFMLCFDALTELGAFMRIEFLSISKSCIGTQGEVG